MTLSRSHCYGNRSRRGSNHHGGICSRGISRLCRSCGRGQNYFRVKGDRHSCPVLLRNKSLLVSRSCLCLGAIVVVIGRCRKGKYHGRGIRVFVVEQVIPPKNIPLVKIVFFWKLPWERSLISIHFFFGFSHTHSVFP